MQRVFIQVATNDELRSASGMNWLWRGLRAGIDFVVGSEAFRTAYDNASTPQSAISMVTGKSWPTIAAQLRLQGIDPDLWIQSLAQDLGTSTENLTDMQINDAFNKAQSNAKDPSQAMWLWAGLGVLILAGGGILGGTKGGRRFARRTAGRFHAARRYRQVGRGYARRGRARRR